MKRGSCHFVLKLIQAEVFIYYFVVYITSVAVQEIRPKVTIVPYTAYRKSDIKSETDQMQEKVNCKKSEETFYSCFT